MRVGLALVLLASGIASGCVDSSRLATAPMPAPSPTGCPFAVHVPPPPYGTNPAVDSEPYAITKVAPEYPDSAREAHVEGLVVVVALVCEHGYVVDVRVATSVPMLDAAAVAAVRQWTFRPARKGLKAVPFWTDVPVRFSLH